MPGKILVVDDLATNRIILKAKLAMACYDVIQAENGHEALRAAASEWPDLILLDLAMPGMSGLEVLAALKANETTASIPVVVVTSHADLRNRLAALRAGADDLLTKPVDDMILAARVRSLLRTRLLTDELALRDSTRRALGFSGGAVSGLSEAAAPFAHAGTGVDDAHPPAGHVALIELTGAEPGWTDGLTGRVPHPLVRMSRSEAMRLAMNPAVQADDGRGWTDWPTRAAVPEEEASPEIYVICAGRAGAHEAHMLVAELRAAPGAAHAPVVIVLPASAPREAAIAFDLGASDVLTVPLHPEEAALRLGVQVSHARKVRTLRKRLRDGLELAVTDPLTGLPNRRYGLSHFERLVQRAVDTGGRLSAMMLDLDWFKGVNDDYGHAAGDAVLRAVAARLQAHLKAEDLLARVGGEEFLVVLPDASPKEAVETAERLLRAISGGAFALPPPPGPRAGGPPSGAPTGGRSARMRIDPKTEVFQTLSIGLATGPSAMECALADARGHAAAAVALLHRADAALLAAKDAGRNRVMTSKNGRAGEAAA